MKSDRFKDKPRQLRLVIRLYAQMKGNNRQCLSAKKIEEISELIGAGGSILILACNGCAETLAIQGNHSWLLKMNWRAGHKVRNIPCGFCLRALSGEALVGGCRTDFDSILVVSCGVGVQTVAINSMRPTQPPIPFLSGRIGQAWGDLVPRMR